MFERPGQKIQLVAKILAVLLLVGGFLVGLILAISLESAELFFMIFPGAAITAVLSGLFLYGFGTLIQSSEANEANTREILQILRGGPTPQAAPASAVKMPTPQAAPAPSGTKPTPQDAPEPTVSKSAAAAKKPNVPPASASDFETCPVCKAVQYAGRTSCIVCGAPFVREPAPKTEPDPTPEKTEAAPLVGTLREEVTYALQFNTDEGMLNYLKNSKRLSADEQTKLSALLAGPEDTLRRRLQARLEG